MKFIIEKGPHNKIKHITGTLPISFIKEDNQIITYCPALDICAYDSTKKKSRKQFEQVLVIFFEELIKMGTLNIVLKENGWKSVSTNTNKPAWIPPAVHNENFDVPVISS